MKNDLNYFEKTRIVSNLAATILIPLAIALVGNWYTSAIKQKELSAKYVELAIKILNKEPSEGSEEIRQWAIKIINTYSEVKIPEQLKIQLLLKPLEIKVNVDVKVDKSLDNFFDEIDQESNVDKEVK